MGDKSKSGYIKKSRGRSKSSDGYKENVRKAHKIYFKDDEWQGMPSMTRCVLRKDLHQFLLSMKEAETISLYTCHTFPKYT